MRTGISIGVSPFDRDRLEAIVRDRNAAQKHVWRAEIVLLTADGFGTGEIESNKVRGHGYSPRPCRRINGGRLLWLPRLSWCFVPGRCCIVGSKRWPSSSAVLLPATRT